MRTVGIIPARMASSRYPGKPMAEVHGIPMVGHVYLRAKLCPLLDEVHVATCDHVVHDYIRSIGGAAVMTADTHERASDRVAEAMLKVEKANGRTADIVVMIQGDEPMVTPGMLNQAIQAMRADVSVNVVNLMGELATREEEEDPNEVKVVVDARGDALYFSREAIPSGRKGATEMRRLKQIGVVLFRRGFLIQFNALPQNPLEIIESVDMLRVLEHGHKVRMIRTDVETYSVDTPEDLRAVEAAMKEDPLLPKYARYRRSAAT